MLEVSKRRKDLTTMTAREMFSLWWQERWVRYLVISLAPIGLVDVVYTLLLWNSFGAAYEFNPFVRLALSTQWWIAWCLIDIVSFSLFAMIAGSYYLHTRSRIFGNRTGWLALLVGFRLGAATYNISLFYNYDAPVAAAVLTAVMSSALMWQLLRRTDDISKRGFKEYWMVKYNLLRDKLLKRGTRVDVKAIPIVANTPAIRDSRTVFLKRAGYLSVAVLVFVTAPFFLVLLADATGASSFSSVYGMYVFWNNLSGPAFVIGFFAIVILSAAMMYFILKAFSAAEGRW
jgi:hypothetical protein